ncbi:hypothetical protein K1T71_005299 [Dendrolimus kikuchii]|uniref:Uncharacterized protein n=1 Tax=Dendrolimus kikuchii TaxID=765133 RepID=A0ACC1D849_9NEOP|nr:hypothetical protein K1T71_005299 [Dendrolimus kikuchii]
MNLCIRTKCLRYSLINSFYRFSTTTEVVDQNEKVLIDDSDETKVREDEIEKKRNISRLSTSHYNIENGRKPYEEPKHWTHIKLKYYRKMYGKYGSASGVDPNLCWPTKEEIQEKLEYESVAYPYTIQQMMKMAQEKRLADQQAIEKRDRDVAAKFEKLQQWKKELNDKVAKKAAEVHAAKERKERLVEEVRRHFGFTLDPRDERFQEMLAKREKEQKKMEKIAKKEAKEKVMIAKLQQQNVDLAGQTAK